MAASVPGIGLAEANSRRAASGDPLGTGGRAGPEAWCSRCGRLRNRRASSSTSRKAWSRQARAIRSSRSPCSPVVEVDPMPGGALAAVRPGETDHQAAARRVVDVADAPGVPLAPAVGEVFAAHGLGVLREAAGQLGGGPHVTRPPARRSAAADSAPSALASTSAPRSSVGTNILSFQAMISWKRP